MVEVVAEAVADAGLEVVVEVDATTTEELEVAEDSVAGAKGSGSFVASMVAKAGDERVRARA